MPTADFIDACGRERLLIVLPAGDNVVRLLPPLTIGEAEVREGMALIDKAATALERSQSRRRNERAA